MATSLTRTRTAIAGAGLAALACSAAPSEGDLAEVQVVAATEVARAIARNPGPLETICVAYSGGWEDPRLPADVPGIAFAYAEGCQEINGQLFARGSAPGGGDTRAIWLGVAEPEDVGGRETRVRVFTSTGLDDAASYACTVRWSGGGWILEACTLEAMS